MLDRNEDAMKKCNCRKCKTTDEENKEMEELKSKSANEDDEEMELWKSKYLE